MTTTAANDLRRLLHRAFDGRVDPRVIDTEITRAEVDLHGQVRPGTEAELMYRLIAYRLADRDGSASR